MFKESRALLIAGIFLILISGCASQHMRPAGPDAPCGGCTAAGLSLKKWIYRLNSFSTVSFICCTVYPFL